MKFGVLYQQTTHDAHSPIRVVEQTTGRSVGWINRYLDREYVRRPTPPYAVTPTAGCTLFAGGRVCITPATWPKAT